MSDLKTFVLTHSFNEIRHEDYEKLISLWSYDVGIEIECSAIKDYHSNELRSLCGKIPFKEFDFSSLEQRFRLPAGFKGFLCLGLLSEFMAENFYLNPDSGIHYHIDFTDVYDNCISDVTVKDVEKYILQELESWNYIGAFNRKEVKIGTICATWVRFQNGFKTMEVRIGEMTFDYNLLLQRILHLQEIAKKVKEDLINYNPFDETSENNIINFVKNRTVIRC